MANIVIIGAGLGGVIAAYEIKDQLSNGDKITVVNKGRTYHFVPSNPWVAVKWRTRDAIEVDLTHVFKKRGIESVSYTHLDVYKRQQLLCGAKIIGICKR